MCVRKTSLPSKKAWLSVCDLPSPEFPTTLTTFALVRARSHPRRVASSPADLTDRSAPSEPISWKLSPSSPCGRMSRDWKSPETMSGNIESTKLISLDCE